MCLIILCAVAAGDTTASRWKFLGENLGKFDSIWAKSKSCIPKSIGSPIRLRLYGIKVIVARQKLSKLAT